MSEERVQEVLLALKPNSSGWAREAAALIERQAARAEAAERDYKALRELFDSNPSAWYARVEAAEAEARKLRELMNCYNLGGWTDSLRLIQERDALREQLAACERDAARYRWIRSTPGIFPLYYGKDLDDAIDEKIAAMSAKEDK